MTMRAESVCSFICVDSAELGVYSLFESKDFYRIKYIVKGIMSGYGYTIE